MRTKRLVLAAFLLALQIVLSRYLSIELPILKISFTFIPLAITGYYFGPLRSGGLALIADLIGIMLAPKNGVYYPGFSVSAFLIGASYGMLEKGKSNLFPTLIGVVLFNSLFVNLGLNSFWLHRITGKAWRVLMVPRIIKTLVMMPIKMVILYPLLKRIHASYN